MRDRYEAIERLYAETGPALLAYARSLVRDPASAEDVLQQVFMRLAARSQDTLPREPRPYLFRAVRNACLNVRRAAAREAARLEQAPPMFTAPPSCDGLAGDLEAALAALPPEQREVVILRVWGELTLEATARTLAIPANTAASRYRYALARLRHRFGVHLRS